MKTLSKYVLKEHIVPFIGGLAIIMFVLLMDFILDILNLIIAKGVDAGIVLKLFSFNLAWMVALAVPMACLIAGLMAFGRLAEDGEIIASRSSGISSLRLMLLPLVAALILSGFMIYFSNNILPDANYQAKLLLGDIKRKKPTLAIKERVFVDDFPGIGMYVEEVDSRAGELRGITIYDQKDRRIPRIIEAEYGEMSYSEESDALTLDLRRGSIHEIDEDDPENYTRIEFDRQTIRFTDLGQKLERRESGHRGDRELSMADMKERIVEKDSARVAVQRTMRTLAKSGISRAFTPSDIDSSQAAADSLPADVEIFTQLRREAQSTRNALKSQLNALRAHERYIRKYKVEVNKKITLPLACFFFLLVGAPVGVRVKKGGLGIAIGLGLGFFVIYWAFLIGGEELADRGFLVPWLSMWLPNFVMAAIAGGMIYRTVWSSRFRGFGLLRKLARWVSGLFGKKQE